MIDKFPATMPGFYQKLEIKNKRTASADLDKLLYRSQFILGPHYIEKFKSWTKIKVSNTLCLNSHPDLNTYQAINRDKSITLLGYILDPNNPDDNDSEIVDKLLQKLSTNESFMKHTYDLGGRWILIVNDGREIRLFNDAAGLRQVCYSDGNYIKETWCASQPKMIAEILNLEMDKIAVNFINAFKRKKEEYYWTGDSTPYKEIKHLLPNHYFDLETRLYHRYWPDKAFYKMPLDKAVEKCSVFLKGLLKSASNRYNLVLSLSCGLDSRLMLASCEEIRDGISYLTEIKKDMDENHPDLKIPSALLSKFDLNHDVVKPSTKIVNDDFTKIFYKNVPFAHDTWAPKARAYFDYYNLDKVVIVGTVSETARCYYHESLKGKKKNVTSHELSMLYGMENEQFAINSYEEWLLGLSEIYNYSLLDLFYWELNCRWTATNNLEFDIGWQDRLDPFNCRSLLINMLSVDEIFRTPPEYKLYKKLILDLWPEVLSYPINPHKRKSFIKNYRKRLGKMKKSILMQS